MRPLPICVRVQPSSCCYEQVILVIFWCKAIKINTKIYFLLVAKSVKANISCMMIYFILKNYSYYVCVYGIQNYSIVCDGRHLICEIQSPPANLYLHFIYLVVPIFSGPAALSKTLPSAKWHYCFNVNGYDIHGSCMCILFDCSCYQAVNIAVLPNWLCERKEKHTFKFNFLYY